MYDSIRCSRRLLVDPCYMDFLHPKELPPAPPPVVDAVDELDAGDDAWAHGLPHARSSSAPSS
jgi:hypothetical protein